MKQHRKIAVTVKFDSETNKPVFAVMVGKGRFDLTTDQTATLFDMLTKAFSGKPCSGEGGTWH